MSDSHSTSGIVGSISAIGDGKGAVRMEDVYDTSAEDLWSALTDPDRLARWIAAVAGDLRVGGTFHARFTSGWEGPGRVEICRQPERLLVVMAPGSDRRNRDRGDAQPRRRPHPPRHRGARHPDRTSPRPRRWLAGPRGGPRRPPRRPRTPGLAGPMAGAHAVVRSVPRRACSDRPGSGHRTGGVDVLPRGPTRQRAGDRRRDSPRIS